MESCRAMCVCVCAEIERRRHVLRCVISAASTLPGQALVWGKAEQLSPRAAQHSGEIVAFTLFHFSLARASVFMWHNAMHNAPVGSSTFMHLVRRRGERFALILIVVR